MVTKTIVLTDEEISKYIDNLSLDDTFDNWLEGKPWKIVAKAQLKKVVEWGKEECPHEYDIVANINMKRECFICWQEMEQALLKEVE